MLRILILCSFFLASTASAQVGTLGDDILHGTDWADWIHGDAGDDEIYGHGGDDKLIGGDGADYLEDNEGCNIFDAVDGEANDIIDCSGSEDGCVDIVECDVGDLVRCDAYDLIEVWDWNEQLGSHVVFVGDGYEYWEWLRGKR